MTYLPRPGCRAWPASGAHKASWLEPSWRPDRDSGRWSFPRIRVNVTAPKCALFPRLALLKTSEVENLVPPDPSRRKMGREELVTERRWGPTAV